MAKPTILVTGGAGFIGSALVRRLVQEGHVVRVLDSLYRGDYSRLDGLSKNLECVDGDVRDLPTVEEAMEGIDEVWHLAAINGTKNFYEHPDRVLNVGVKGIVNVLDRVRKQRVRRLFVA